MEKKKKKVVSNDGEAVSVEGQGRRQMAAGEEWRVVSTMVSVWCEHSRGGVGVQWVRYRHGGFSVTGDWSYERLAIRKCLLLMQPWIWSTSEELDEGRRETQMSANADTFFGWGRLRRSSPDGQVGGKPTCWQRGGSRRDREGVKYKDGSQLGKWDFWSA